MTKSKVWVWSNNTYPDDTPNGVKLPNFGELSRVLGYYRLTYSEGGHFTLTASGVTVTGNTFNHCLQMYQQRLNRLFMSLYVRE